MMFGSRKYPYPPHGGFFPLDPPPPGFSVPQGLHNTSPPPGISMIIPLGPPCPSKMDDFRCPRPLEFLGALCVCLCVCVCGGGVGGGY